MAYEFASRLETFPKYRKFETTFAGRPFVVETGKMCGLSNGSAMIRYGETCVLCNVTMSDKPRDGVDFFPLSVEFEENSTPPAASPAASCAVRAAPASTPSCPPASLTAPSARCSRRICATMSA